MYHLVATRTELLRIRDRLALAERSRDLLEDKRTELMKAVRKVADVVIEGSEALQRAAAESVEALVRAMEEDGIEQVQSAGIAAVGEITLQVVPTVIMGVRLPEVRWSPLGRPRASRGYSMAETSARIDHAADRFERELDLLLEVATHEMRLKRLAQEIRKVTRRVNALREVLIPELRADQRRIRSVLAERERQDRFRLVRLTHQEAP